MKIETVFICIWLLLLISFPFLKINKLKIIALSYLGILALGYVHIYLDTLPPLGNMLINIAVLMLTIKGIMLVTFISEVRKMRIFDMIVFIFLWNGVNPTPFFNRPYFSKDSYSEKILTGILCILIGSIVCVVGVYLVRLSMFIGGIFILIGISFLFHFGFIKLQTILLRKMGYNVNYLFDSPIKSNTLKEFWGKRWNTAFSEMTAILVFKPLVKRCDKNYALFFSFLFSGILHEIAISLPAKGGYGLPTLYFMIQYLLILIETQFKISSKIWTITCLICFLNLIFPKPFIENIIYPSLASIIK